MLATAPKPTHRRPAGGRLSVGLILAVVAGVVCMHALDAGHHVPAAPLPSAALTGLIPQPVSAPSATVAPDAGAGTGCGPPSLTMLSISRT